MRKIISHLNSKTFSLLAIFCLLTACNSNVLVNEAKEVENKVWRDQIINFEFDITDTSKAYDLVLEIEHDADFPYQNIYTQVKVIFPDTTPARIMPVSLDLADDLGLWLGKCNSTSCTVPLAFMTNTKFTALGKHSISFKQYSRLDEIVGFSKMRFKLIRLD